MKLNDQTVSILKNFSTINQNLVIKEGSEITTMSAMKNIVSKATVEETFPVEFAIYDLNEFLSAMSLFTKPDLDFKDDFVVITESGSKGRNLKYWYSEPSVVTTPSREVTMPSVDVEFPMNSGILSEVQKAAAVIGAPDMVLEDDELRVTDKKNDTANSYSTSLDTKSDDDGEIHVNEIMLNETGDHFVVITNNESEKTSRLSLIDISTNEWNVVE